MELAEPILKLPPTPKMIAAGRGNQFKRPNLMECHQHFFGTGFDGAHSALADARACKAVYFKIKAIESAI